MLLLLDVGNTNTVLGLYTAEDSHSAYTKLLAHWRVATIQTQTVDEYGVLFRNLFAMEGMEATGVAAIVISSGMIFSRTPPLILPTVITTGAFVNSDWRETIICKP